MMAYYFPETAGHPAMLRKLRPLELDALIATAEHLQKQGVA